MSALNCDNEKAFELNRDAGHCDSKDSVFANSKTNFSSTTVDPKNGDDCVKKSPLCDSSSAESTDVKSLVPSTLVSCSGINTGGECFLDQSLSRLTGNDFSSQPLCEEVRLGDRERHSDGIKMDACSASQSKSTAGVQLECNTSGHFLETADITLCSSLQKPNLISLSSEKSSALLLSSESKNKVRQSHEFSSNNKQTLAVNDALTLQMDKQDDRKVVDKCLLGVDDSIGNVTMRRKRGATSAVTVGPDAELSQVLQRRSNYLSDWEVQQSSQQILTEADRRILDYEKKLEEEKARRQRELDEAMPVIVNEELSKIMSERKEVVDSLISVDKQGMVDDIIHEMDKSASTESVLKLDSDFSSVASVVGDEAGLNSDSDRAAETLNQVSDIEVRRDNNENLGSQRTVVRVDECSYKLCSGNTSTLNAGGVKVIASETSIRKSSWNPVSHSLLNPGELSPRQKTQPVTSKEVEKALQSSSLSPDLIPAYGAVIDEDDSQDRPKARGILKTHEHEKTPLRGILKHRSDHRDAPVKGILKAELPEAESKGIHGILKHDSASSVSDRRHQGILKREKESANQAPVRGSLRRDVESEGGEGNMEPEVATSMSSWHSKDQLLNDDQSSDGGADMETQSSTSVNEYCAHEELEEGMEKMKDSDGDDKEDKRTSSVQKGGSESAENKVESEFPSVQTGVIGSATDNEDRRSAEGKWSTATTVDGISTTDKEGGESVVKETMDLIQSKRDRAPVASQEDSASTSSQEDSGPSSDQENRGSAADQGDSGSSVDQVDNGSAADKGDLVLLPYQDDNVSVLDQGSSGSTAHQGDSDSAVEKGDSDSAADQGDSVFLPDQSDNISAADQGDSFVADLDADMNSKFHRPELGRSVSHIRHSTEPTTSDAIQETDSLLQFQDIRAENITPKSSVSERLAALQKSGDNWKRRKEPAAACAVLPGRRLLSGVAINEAGGGGTSDTTEVVRRMKLTPQPTTRPESIADRLSLLRGAQEGWKSKVTEKDTKMFTVEGKLDRHGIVMESPLQPKTDTPGKEVRPRVVKIEVTPPTDISPQVEEPEEKAPVVVAVPTFDSKLMTAFFSTPLATTPETKVNVTFDDFDHIFLNSNDVLKPIQKPTPKRTKTGSRNPLKTMSQHITLQNEYREECTGIAERELKRIKKERVIGTPLLAQEALAGLASKENFSKVSLRKAESFHGTGLGDRHLPHKEIMLLHVKGRKWCQTRLIEPQFRSINSGDCYLLVTPDVVFLYVGKFSNIIERNKSHDLASQITQKHDLCVRPACELAVLDEEKPCRSRYLTRFWTLLGEKIEPSVVQGPRTNDEDDWYEASINFTNRVYSFRQDELVFLPDYSGKLLKHEMLRTSEIFVFDFGSEMYVWIGKQAVFEKRRVAVKLAYELWQKGYDFKDDIINPLSPLNKESDGGIPVSGKERPKWTLFGKVNQNMETVLFKEKFIDWPDATRLIKAKGRVSEGEGKADLISDLKPCDAKKMFEKCRTPVTMLLEGSHVGRGKSWEEVQDGIKWEYEIRTHETKVWHVTEFSAQELDSSSYGHFHTDDTYVVRWRYSIHQLARTLKGKESHKTETGRVRCVYFFWQGQHSSINEKGASALMTVELDTERGPQVQLSQGKEPPCFLNLFSGQMVVHLRKRSSESQDSTLNWKLFVVRNEMPNEICLLEVPVAAKNLRSRTSFLLLNVQTGSAFVWHGTKAAQSVQKATMQIATNLEKRCPKEFGLAKGKVIKVVEIREDSETKEFWSDLGGRCSRSSYGSLLDDCRSCDHSPRLFFMTSVSGTFEAKEILNPVANDNGVASAYPFLQSDLYIEEQPALFLLDNHHEVYLWQGWWPLQTGDDENVHTGSAETRFNVNRKCAMETALAYSREISVSKPPPVYLVYAGCEPVELTSLFPRWQPDERAIVSPTKGSRTNRSLELVSDVLAKLTRNDYTFEELKQRPLPDGVDPLKLEMYLADNEFEMFVGMTRKEFAELQPWRQTEIKQKVGLF